MSFVYSLIAVLHPLVYAQASSSSAGTTSKASGWQTYGMWIIIAVMLVVFYMLLIRPQRKRAQEHEGMMTELKKGDEVITIGGLHGTIKRVTDDTIVLEVDKGVTLTFSKSAISRRVSVEEEEEEEAVEPEPEAEPEAAEEEETETEHFPSKGKK